MALAKALKDTYSYVRSSAALALGKIKPQNENIHIALAEALKDTIELRKIKRSLGPRRN